MKIHLSRLHFPVTTLGPGRRIGIWLQGCSIRCPGCVSVDTWAPERGRTTVESVLVTIADWMVQCDGVTISGGEPFDQPEALVALVVGLNLRAKQDVLIYSGYPLEEIAHVVDKCQGKIDAVISDPFIAGAPQTRPLRGSDNQRLHLFSAPAREAYARYELPTEEAPRLDIMFDEEGAVWLAGVPRQRDMARLRVAMEEMGHSITTSAAQHDSH